MAAKKRTKPAQDNGDVTVALVQMSCSTKREENLAKAERKIKEASQQGAQIVCLQELFASRYFCQIEHDSNFELAESIPGPTSRALSRAAADAKVVLIGSVFERRAPGVFHNTAVIIDSNGELLGIYRKMHIPDDPRYYEKFHFTPGDAEPGFQAWNTKQGKIGVLVCWDQWFPEAARLTALAGAQILFYPTAIGWHKEDGPAIRQAQVDAWELAQRAHALANGCFVCAVNRVGREDDLQFWGGSFVADPFGRIIAKASADKEETLLVRCNRASIDVTRRQWPFLRDRRVDAYGGLLKRLLD
ncbi:MAG TPA: carbon-nitrogen hydrolase [Planctomycetota bacterium]|jgi:N-carbamoylputrescine amidase